MSLSVNDFSTGDVVVFGRLHGEQTQGMVVKVNSKKLKVRQMGSRGVHKDGTIWVVPPSFCQKIGDASPSTIAASVAPTPPPVSGSELENATVFAQKAKVIGLPEDCLGKTLSVQGKALTIMGIDLQRRKYPVKVRGAQGGMYIIDVAATLKALQGVTPAYKPTLDPCVDFTTAAKMLNLPEDCKDKTVTLRGRMVTIVGLRPSDKNAVVIKGAQGGHYVASADEVREALKGTSMSRPFAIGTRVSFTSVFSKGLQNGWLEDYADDGRPRILTPYGVQVPALAEVQRATTARTETSVMNDILCCHNSLSPENLSCDGEASRAHQIRRRGQLTRCLNRLFAEIGRTISEEDAYKWYDANRSNSI